MLGFLVLAAKNFFISQKLYIGKSISVIKTFRFFLPSSYKTGNI
jgi:hypothetical protein